MKARIIYSALHKGFVIERLEGDEWKVYKVYKYKNGMIHSSVLREMGRLQEEGYDYERRVSLFFYFLEKFLKNLLTILL